MLKLLNKTIKNVNNQHRKKWFSNYQIFIEDKNKYAHQLAEEVKWNKYNKCYLKFLDSNLLTHKVGYTQRKRFRICTIFSIRILSFLVIWNYIIHNYLLLK